MRILKHGREQSYLGDCPCCGCGFECQLTDGAIPQGTGWRIPCPECRRLTNLRPKSADGFRAGPVAINGNLVSGDGGNPLSEPLQEVH